MGTKINIYLFFQDWVGGVANYVKTLISNLDSEKYFFTIILMNCKEHNPLSSFEVIKTALVEKERIHIFRYSSFDNKYYTLKRLKTLIGNDCQLIITNNSSLDLEMLNYYKIDIPIISIIHSDYSIFYEISTKFSGIINSFITVSKFIKEELAKKVPSRINDIHYIRQLHQFDLFEERNYFNFNGHLRLLFVGRIEKEKGADRILEIDDLLKSSGIKVTWSIVGPSYDPCIYSAMVSRSNFKVFQQIKHENVIELYFNNDIFILPSIREGLPISLLEAMSASLVPLVTNLQSGISEIVDKSVGFSFNIGDVNGYVEAIKNIDENRSLIEFYGRNSRNRMDNLFNLQSLIDEIQNIISNTLNIQHKKLFIKSKPTLLNNPYYPNFIVRPIKILLNKILKKRHLLLSVILN